MVHVVCFSGGKDSTALVLWAKENLPEFTVAYCDTGWENPITYAYVEYINQTLLEGKLVTLRSKTYPGGFVQLAVDRKGIPSTKRRFCTSELKVFPLHAYFESLDDEVTSYQGIRADESQSRAAMREVEWLDDAGGYWIRRPLLRPENGGAGIMRRFGLDTARAVDVLTRARGEAYRTYIMRVGATADRIALAVKIADLLHNTDAGRVAHLRKATALCGYERSWSKTETYLQALGQLVALRARGEA